MGELTRRSPAQVVAPIHSKTTPVILTTDEGDGLIGDELRYRELDDALGLTAPAGDVLADARTGKNGRHAVAIGVRPSRWLQECERCRTSSSRSCNALDRRRQGAQGRAASPSQLGRQSS
jgi:hypothetical protein